jgi:hypothetical protein
VALTIAIEGKGSISVGDSTTETWGKTGLISAVQDETDIVLQGSNAASTKASAKSGWIYFDIGAGNELDFTPTTGSEADQLVYIWINVTTVGALDTLANKGLAIQIGSSTTNFDYWTIFGSDAAAGYNNKYSGGWICVVVDPENTAYTGQGGSGLNTASARYFGIYISTTSSSKSENLIIDQITVGKGLRISGSDVTGWQEVADYCNDFTNRAWGQFQEEQSGFLAYGMLYIGSTARNTSMIDDGRSIKWGDFEYYTGSAWASAIPDGVNGLTVEDDATYTTTFQDGVLVGSDAGRSGSVWTGSDNTTTTWDLYGGNNAASLTKLYGSILKNIDGGITWGNDSDHHCYSVSMAGCGQFDPVGAVKIRNCIFSEYAGSSDAAILWNSNIDISDSRFIANTRAIEHPATGSFTYNTLLFSGNTTADVVNSNNSTTTDSYSESNQDQNQQLYSGGATAVAQSITGDGNKLTSLTFYLRKAGTPTGTAVAKLYAHSGVFGTSSVPTGAALATSKTFTPNDLTTGYVLTKIDFDDLEFYTLVNATKYCVVVEYSGGDSSNRLEVGFDQGGSHGGNKATYTGSWAADGTDDLCFYVRTGGDVTVASNGSDPATTVEDGSPAGTTNINSTVTVKVTAKDSGDASLLENVQVYVKAASGGDLPVDTEILLDLTNASGIAQNTSFEYTNPQPVAGWCRRATPAYGTLYKEFPISGTITLAAGFTTIALMVSDE